MSNNIPPVVSAASDPEFADEIWRLRLSGIALMIVSVMGIAVALYFYLTPLSPLPPNATEGYKNGRDVALAFRNPLLLPINFFYACRWVRYVSEARLHSRRTRQYRCTVSL